MLKLAEQAIRENFAKHFGLELTGVTLLRLKNGRGIMATVNGVRTLGKKEIEDLEAEVRQRTGDRKMNLHILFNQLDLYDRWGKFNYEWSSLDMSSFFRALLTDKKNEGNNLGCILTEGPGRLIKKFLPIDEELKKLMTNYFDTLK